MEKEKSKKKKRFRFFNRPVKIGATFAGVGLGLEFGNADILTLLADHPEYIFWLEVIKYASIITGILFAGGGVAKQAKEDLESIKIGETVKEGVEKIEALKAKPENTKVDEAMEEDSTMKKALDLAKGFFKKRRKK